MEMCGGQSIACFYTGNGYFHINLLSVVNLTIASPVAVVFTAGTSFARSIQHQLPYPLFYLVVPLLYRRAPVLNGHLGKFHCIAFQTIYQCGPNISNGT
jgi:hypothetical protein